MFESLSQFDPKSVAIGIIITSIVVALLMRRVLKIIGTLKKENRRSLKLTRTILNKWTSFLTYENSWNYTGQKW